MSQPMKRIVLVIAAAGMVVIATACLQIIHETQIVYVYPEAGVPLPVPVPQADLGVRHAQALYVVNLEAGASNLASSYEDTIRTLHAALAAFGVVVDEFAVAPLYGSPAGAGTPGGAPGLVYGESQSGAGLLGATLQQAAQTGDFNQPIAGVTAEQYNLAALAAHLDTATLPPSQAGGTSRPAYTLPRDLFLVVTIQPTKRQCADTDSACVVPGANGPAAPSVVFSSVDGAGDAAWIRLPGGGVPAAAVYQVFIATAEDESWAQFQAACSAVPAFQPGLFDVLAPSPVKYYDDLTTALVANAAHAERVDLCSVLGGAAQTLLGQVAERIAKVAFAQPPGAPVDEGDPDASAVAPALDGSAPLGDASVPWGGL